MFDKILTAVNNLIPGGGGSMAVMVLSTVFVLCLLIKIIETPMKLIFKLALNTVLGMLLLNIINFFGSVIGFGIGITWQRAMIAGVFGSPGVLVLVLLKLTGFIV